MPKFPSFLLIVLLATSSLVLVNSANAQMQKPDVPEFTVFYMDYSYNLQPQTTIDQYTGRNVTTDYSYRVDNRTVTFTIKNQQFTPYTDSSGNLIKLIYNIRYKGPYGNDTNWNYYPDTSRTYGLYTGVFPETSASKTQTTTIQIRLAELASYPTGTPAIPSDAEIEFQVQAIEGYITSKNTGLTAGNFMGFEGERSDWSSTQTIFTEQNPQAPTPAPACSLDSSVVPMQQETLTIVTSPFDWRNLAIAVLAAALAASTSVALILKKKTSPQKTVKA